MKVDKIVIVGGGTSGWLTAAYLLEELITPVKITLIESTKIGPIGVGEGTQPYTMTFLRRCGLEPKDWMPAVDATYKLGVEFVGWHNDPFFVDNDSIKTHVVNPRLLSHQSWVGVNPNEYYDWLPAYRLAKTNTSPKLTEDLDFVIGSDSVPSEAVHFNAYKVTEILKNKILDKITYIDAEVTSIKKSDNGISSIEINNTTLITADLFIDCTGFKSWLLEKTLESTHISINDILPCDSAVAIPTQYKNKEEECHPYTRSTAMTAGWRWTIPTFNRIGNGYVYSSKYITKSQAEEELRTVLNDYESPALHLDMRCGYKNKIAVDNVIGIGLSAGFVEPLEATGITFTTKTVEMLAHYLNCFENEFNHIVKDSINEIFVSMIKEIIAFIRLHYKTSSKNDTPFWSDVKTSVDPKWIKDVEQLFATPPTDLRKVGVYDMFHSGQWFQVLNASGMYKDTKTTLTDEELTYCSIHRDMLSLRTNAEIIKFPTHSAYLESWYNKYQGG